jgi:hypothetical protein
MKKLVISGATLKCSMGTAPSALNVSPQNKTNCENQRLATVQDFQPNTNIAPFGLCQSLANPQVAAATAAANGSLTPQPCVPATSTPWAPGSATVSVAHQAALTADSKCNCQWAGIIEVALPSSKKTQVG